MSEADDDPAQDHVSQPVDDGAGGPGLLPGWSRRDLWGRRATRLISGERQLEPTGAGMETAAFGFDEFERLLLAGEVKDGPTVSAYGLLRLRGVLT